MQKSISEKKALFFPFIILTLALFFRIYKIAELPLDLHIDEAGLGLNAWSIANFGTDRYGNFLPVCPANFYGEQSAFYTYFCALFIKIFGLSILTLRLPAVIIGMIVVVFGALLIRELLGRRGFYLALILLGFSPIFLSGSRYALDCNSMLGMVCISLFILTKALRLQQQQSPKASRLFFLSGILFGITLYTYIVSVIVLFLFYLFFGMYYLFFQKEGRLIRLQHLLWMSVPTIIVGLPLFLQIYLELTGGNSIITPFFSIVPTISNRASEVSLLNGTLKEKIIHLIHVLTSDGKYGSSAHFWTLYQVSLPLLLLGVMICVKQSIQAIKARRFSFDLVFLLFSLSETVMFWFCGNSNYHINGIYIALVYFCINGIAWISLRIKSSTVKKYYFVMVVLIYALFIGGYLKEYFVDSAPIHSRVYGGVDQIIASLDTTNREVYVLDEVGEFYFLSNPRSPQEASALYNELGYISDYQNLHFYVPEGFHSSDIIICGKDSGWNGLILDTKYTDQSFVQYETEHYYYYLTD